MALEYLNSSITSDVLTKVRNAKVLVVGAGGIGCELIKNLVLSGFESIHVVDLDTIDVSNLNRQFLFRSEHVGLPKAVVAREVALRFNPNAKIVAHHGNIKTPQFGLDYIRSFSLVLNALDNVDARRHVNRMCLATGVPLIESGTTGYLGQVSVIKKGETECYECTGKVTQKVYPICTIRSTPDKPVHCIVWAKECYKLLFGKQEDSMLWEDPKGDEKSSFMHLVQPPTSRDQKDLQEFARNAFRGLFEYEIEKKLGMNLYKTAKEKPQPLVLDAIEAQEIEPETKAASGLPDHAIWSIKKCAEKFVAVIVEMYSSEETQENLGSYVFDKDDKLPMEFVTAASNLRASIFHIQLQSLHSCKGIAGNIIPAIATTNAIIAGLQVLEAFKIVQAAKPISETCKYTYCNRAWNSRGVLLTPIALSKPNPNCFACSQTMMELQINTKTTLLQDLVTKVIKKALGVNEPSISIGASTLYEEGEDAEELLAKNLSKLLIDQPAGGINHGTTIVIEDFSQDFSCSIAVIHRDDFDEKETPEMFILGREQETTSTAPPKDTDEDDDICIEDKSTSKKRSLDDGEGADAKRTKVSEDVPVATEVLE